jgi:hypothetical protein
MSLPLTPVFIVLSVILGICMAVWTWSFGRPLEGFMFLALIPPFLSLVWLIAGLGVLVQWMNAKRAWINRELSLKER